LADNITALGNSGSGTDVLATDDIGGVHYPRTKLVIGADGVNGGDVHSGNPLPVAASALPLPTGAATQSTLAAVGANLVTLIDQSPVNASGTRIVGTAREKFRDAFLTYDTVNNWTTVASGSGMTISQAGAANGARYLNIASGTTINAETIITSKVLFRAPTSVVFGLSLSQRITNCDVFVEMVECDPSGVAITDATQASARFKDARNGASFQFTGTVATTQTVNVRQDGLSEVTATGTYTTTVATGTGPNFIPAGLFEMTLRTRDIQFSSVAIDANAAKTAPLTRTMRVPNPDALYMLRIRVLNGGTAPASSTDVRIHSIVVLDDTRMTVDFGSVAGAANLLNAAPVQVANAVAISGTVPVSGTLTSAGTVTATPAAPTASIVNSAGSTNGTVVKATAGTVYGVTASNINAAIRYLKLYNSATVTVGTTTPAITLAIPAGGFVSVDFGALGMRFGTGICLAMTTGAADADTGAVVAGEIKSMVSFI
jgi:hypothetical protein